MARSSATLMIDIAADVAKLRTGFEQAEKMVGNFGKKFSSLGTAFKVGLAGLGVGLGINAIRQMASAAGNIGEHAEAVGLGVENFQALTVAMQQAGVESDKVSKILAKSADLFGKALGGDKSSLDMLNKLGVNLLDASGNAVEFDDAMVDLTKSIAATEDPMKKVALARQAFGRGGEQMIPALEKIAEGFAKMRAQAELGILSKDAVERFDAFFDRAQLLGKYLSTQFLESLNAVAKSPAFQTQMSLFDEAVTKLSKTMKDFSQGDWPNLIGQGFALAMVPVVATVNALIQVLELLGKLPKAAATAKNSARIKFLETQIAMQESAFFHIPGPGWKEELAAWKKELAEIQFGPQTTAEDQARARADASGLQGYQPAKKGGPGTHNPPATGSGDKMREMLLKIQEESSKAAAEFGILQDKMSAPVDDPTQQRWQEGMAKVAERVREIQAEFKKEKLTPSTTDLNNINKWVLATEEWKIKTEHLNKVFEKGNEVRAEFGDGMAAMLEQQKLITEAFALGRINAEEYAAAMKKVKEAQEDQQAGQDKMKDGLAGIAAGFEYAMKKSQRASVEFEIGEKLFDSLTNGMSDSLKQLVQTGAIEFDKLAASFAAMLAEMAAQLAAKAAMNLILSSLGNAFGSFSGPATAGPSPASGAFPHGSQGFVPFGMFKAEGGPVAAGREYMVGEKGPERFVPDVAGRIEPNSSLGGPNITINNNAPGVDVRTERTSEGDLLFIIEKVRNAMTRDVRRGGNPFSVAVGQAYGVARAGR